MQFREYDAINCAGIGQITSGDMRTSFDQAITPVESTSGKLLELLIENKIELAK